MAADSKAKLLEDAERYVLHGKTQQAISEYLKIVTIDPNDVLILNTIGDLYLRQNKVSEANKFFSQVAENYVRNNFFLKAIAVYKKILNADPNNLDINSTMASLYARQGLSIDARNQYLRVASLLEQEGKTKESLDAYEKIVELDPSNADIQRKLAALHLAEGAEDKAHTHWVGAAKAQFRSGDFAGAAVSYGRAVQLVPLDEEAMRGLLECCVKTGNLNPALEQLKRSVEMAPQSLNLREMLGHAYLGSGDVDAAAKAFQMVVSMDEGRYGNLLQVSQAFLDKNEQDPALDTLDPIIPILISRRETNRARQLYGAILQNRPDHVATMERLASIHSATGDHVRYFEALDKIADYHAEKKNLGEALENLEKILRANPESEKHQKLHFQLFAEAYPGTPYVMPGAPQDADAGNISGPLSEKDSSGQEGQSEIVEVDLLINYGLKEKALSLLLSLEARDPYDKEARLRLVTLYKADKKFTQAAEQCLLLAALHRRSKNEEEARSCLSEAKQLAPELAGYADNLEAFARRNGIDLEPQAGAHEAAASAAEEPVDLSSDLLDIFFSGEQETPALEELEDQGMGEGTGVIPEAFPPASPIQASARPVEEQLQEADFYIRLGFHTEALTKLNEIAKISPGNPELASRYEKIGEIAPPAAEQKAPSSGAADASLLREAADSFAPDSLEAFRELDADGALDSFINNAEENAAGPASTPAAPATGFVIEPPPPQTALQAKALQPEFQGNHLFADLMEEVGAISEREIAKESFEDHFSLGTAYRDMELNEEAIKEFELALKIADVKQDARRIVQCCGMLSACFLKKGMPTSAVRWCQTGLSVADISSHEAIALRYDMGVAHSMSGSHERALECFDQIFGFDPGYRDVAQKIDELKGGFQRHAP